MKQILRLLAAILIFSLLIACAALAANAAPGGPLRLSSELPPDFFNEDCDGGADCPGRIFSDMPSAGHWAHLPIDWALTRHITAGTGNGRFSPGAGCTRAQAVTFLWRAAGSPAPQSQSCPFRDVAATAYYRSAVLWAYENGVTSGTGSGCFSPNKVCTRAQIITFLWHAKGEPQASGAAMPFRDVSENAYYRIPVAWAVANGVTGGTGSGTFSPNRTCTRAQIVTFLYKAYRS